jgi:hypothetical protein
MDVRKLSGIFSSIAQQVVGTNKLNLRNSGIVTNHGNDSFVPSSVGQALAQQPNPSVIPVKYSASHLARMLDQAA